MRTGTGGTRPLAAVDGRKRPRVRVPLEPAQAAAPAAAAVLRALLEVIEANLAGAMADRDSEFLHDLRVSVRRSRAVQRELRTAFASEPLERFRTGFRWLQQVTGATRDLDVYLLEFDDLRELVPEDVRADLDPVREVLRRRRVQSRRRLRTALGSVRLGILLAEWRSFLDATESGSEPAGPHGARPIAELAGSRMAKVYRRMVRMGQAIGPASRAEDYHELRKQGKELRYLLELFGAPLYPDEVVSPIVRTLKGLQDVLGRHQDREVQVAMLHSLREEIAVATGGPAALISVGVLIERLKIDERAARAEFARQYTAFSAPRQRRLVRESFG